MKKAIGSKINLILFGFLLLYSPLNFAQSKGFTIKGKIVGAKNGEKVYVRELNKMQYLDSAEVVNQKFILKGNIAEPTPAWLVYKNEYTKIQLENLPITFEAPTKYWLTKSRTFGGREQGFRNKLNVVEFPFHEIYEKGRDSLNNKLFSSPMHQADIVKRLNEKSEINQSKYVAFGKANPNSFLGLDILYRNRKTIGKPEMAELLKKMSPKIRNSSTGKTLALFVATELIKVGQDFFDFTANTINNQPFTLSSLKGQYIYLTFWESGCGPCRLENRLFAKEMNRIAGQLQIVSFSLDPVLKNWKEASNLDGIAWHNVSDLKGNDSPIKIKYDVQGIPHSFLIDKVGKIIKIFSGYSIKMVDELLTLVK